MTRTELAEEVIFRISRNNPLAKRVPVQKLIRRAVYLSVDVIAETLASGEDVRLRNLGSFTLYQDSGRVGADFSGDPSNRVRIPPQRRVRFLPHKNITASLKED